MRFFRSVQFVLFCVVSSCLAPSSTQANGDFEFRDNERIAFVGGSLAERMNLFGNFETDIHLLNANKKLLVRNFGWPADEVGKQQRPDNYTRIDNPLEEFSPELFICFFGFNEHFANEDPAKFVNDYKAWIAKHKSQFSKKRDARFILVSPIALKNLLVFICQMVKLIIRF